MSNPKTITTNTDQLSAVADAIVARAGNPKLTKNTILNLIAAGIAGPKHNWGYLKTHGSEAGQTSALSDAHQMHPDKSMEFTKDGLLLRLEATGNADCDSEIIFLSNQQVLMMDEYIFGDDLAKLGLMIDTNVIIKVEEEDVIITKARGADLHAMIIPGFDLLVNLTGRRNTILEAVLETATGDAIHRAFMTVSESQADLDQFQMDDENNEDFSNRIDKACKEATRLYIAEAARDRSLKTLLNEGKPYQIVNDIIDHNWVILCQVLRG